MPEEIPLENIKEPVRNGESSDAIVNQSEENVNFEGRNEISDETVNNSTDDQVATETSSVAIQNETVSSEDNEIAETKSIDENDAVDLINQKETLPAELESNETANKDSQVNSEVILEGSTNLENESHQHDEKNENDEDTTD